MDRLAETLVSLWHLRLEGKIVWKQPYASCLGGSSEVFKAWSTKHNKKVAVKQIRAFLRRDFSLAKRLAKEIRIWSKLKHKNVLPLLGYFTEGGELMPSLVSEWMEKGTLHDFMKRFPRGGRETCTMIRDIASGLAYLHSKEVIHADLKAQNILISASNTPLLADFGLSLALSHSQISLGISTTLAKGTIRWMAIELLPSISGEEPSKHNKNTDMWAFGMVIYELLSWGVPYNNKPNDVLVLMAIVNGELPERPVRGLDHRIFDRLWEIAQLCWERKSTTRPCAESIRDHLTKDILSSLRTGLHALLVQSSVSGTVQLEAITEELNRNYYNNPGCIYALAQILASSDRITIRLFAAIDLRICICKRDYALWIALPPQVRESLKEMLPRITLDETIKPVHQALARVVAAIASLELTLGTWPFYLTFLKSCCTSNMAAHREVGTFLLFSTLEDGSLTLKGLVSSEPSPGAVMGILFNLLHGLMHDLESANFRMMAVRILIRAAGHLESEKMTNVAIYQTLLPAMLKALELELADARKDGVKKVLDVFGALSSLDVPVLSPNGVRLLVEFLLNAGGDRNREPRIRIMALDALEWIIQIKKIKLQSINLVSNLLARLFPILTSVSPSEHVEVHSPSRTALRIIDTIATVLPPSQVIPPLLQIATAYMADPSRDKRRAALLALSVSVEGCSEYMSSAPASGVSGSGSGQSLLDSQVWPLVEAGLRDGDSAVRRAACTCVGCLCEWLEEACTSRHATLLPALMTLAGRGQRTQREACVALDAFLEVLPEDIIGGYLAELLTALIGLLEDDASSAGASDRQRKARTKVKSTVVGAIGSAAHAAKGKFVQYFEETMRRMEPFLILGKNQTKETTPVYEAEVELRGIAMDAVGTFSEAVGKDTFRPYLPQMMRQAFEGLEMGSARLRECSFLFFGVMARVFGEEFALGGKEQGGEGWLAGAVAALVKSLQQEEKNDGGLGEDAKVAAELFGTGEVSSKSAAGPSTPAKKAASGVTDTEADVDVEDLDGEEGDAILEVNSAIAVEKEIAADTVGTLFAATGVHFLPYVEQCVLELIQLLDHYYEGIRKSSVESILEIVRTFNSLGEPGLPGKEGTGALHNYVKDLVGHCLHALLELYEFEDDKSVVSTLCVGLAETINSLGPAFLEGRLDVISDIAIQILEQKALCQQDPDQDEDDKPLEDQAEFDSVLISSADDLVASLANVLGGDFTTAFQRFFPLISKFYKKGRSLSDRSSAIGCLAEIISGMKGAISPSTQPLLELFYQALSDEADEVQSNAAFATGLLVEHSTVDLTPQYMHLLQALRPLFDVPSDATAQRLTGRDNAVGAVSRLITRNTAAVPLGQVLPPLLAALPLRHDFLENRPLFRCIFHLFRVAPQELVPYLDQLLPVIAHVLNPETSEDQLGTETRAEMLNLVTALNGQKSAKVQAAGLCPHVQGA